MNDTFTVGIILIFVLGAVFFYFYTRLGQVEKRMKLLETILLDLKVATENSFVGFPGGAVVMADRAPVAAGTGVVAEEIEAEEIASEDVEEVAAAESVEIEEVEEAIAEPEAEEPVAAAAAAPVVNEFTPMADIHMPIPSASEVPVSDRYDSMSVKELHNLAKQRGFTGISGMKRTPLIELLRKADAAPAPAAAAELVEDAEPAAVAEPSGALASPDLFGQMAPVE